MSMLIKQSLEAVRTAVIAIENEKQGWHDAAVKLTEMQQNNRDWRKELGIPLIFWAVTSLITYVAVSARFI